MNITEITVRVLLLFFPGIICQHLVDLLTIHRERKAFEVFLLSFIYGLLSYCILGAIISILSVSFVRGIHFPESDLQFFKSMTDGKTEPYFQEVLWAAFVAVLLSFVISAAKNHGWLHRAANRLKISKKFSYINVWEYAFNVENANGWATVRDMKYNLMYQGYIHSYSDYEEVRELFLSAVEVFNEATGAKLYEADHLYVARPADDLTVQFYR